MSTIFYIDVRAWDVSVQGTENSALAAEPIDAAVPEGYNT
jgi:hypothetical protein